MNGRFSVMRCLCQVLVFAMLTVGPFVPPSVAVEALASLQQQWARAMYEVAPEQREPLLSALAEQVRLASAKEGPDADVLVWKGIILSTLAGERGGFGALSLAKEAKAALEASLALNKVALDGSAATSLGTLYHQVPGWPIGFGSKKKALRYLELGLEANPSGIDANFFLAKYWSDNGRKQLAKKYLLVAQLAPARAGREVADAGRQQEIAALLDALGE